MELWDIAQFTAVIFEVIFFMYFIWRFYGRILNNKLPDVQDLDEEMENIVAELSEIRSKQNVFHQEIFEYMDGILIPLNKRMTTRLRRTKEEDLKEEDTSKRSGMLHLRGKKK